MRPTTTPHRAPALYFSGRTPAGVPYSFRLPCPPTIGKRHGLAQAVERRAKKAYFAALDALVSGQVDPERDAKLRRLITEVRTDALGVGLVQLVRAMNAAGQAGGLPLIPAPPAPLDEIVATATCAHARETLLTHLAWPLEWLRTRGWVVASGLRVHCAG